MATKGKNIIFASVISCLVLLLVPCCSETDTLLQGQQLKDGEELISAFGKFRLGFFSTYDSISYLGIWYNRISEDKEYFYDSRVVWVGNRNTPIPDKSGILSIDSADSNLKISHSTNRGKSIPLTSVEAGVPNTCAILLETGNLVLREINTSDGCRGRALWESFDYPTDTLLPGMKLGNNLRTGHTWSLTSSRWAGIPSQGSYSLGLETNQLVIRWLGDIYWTSGPWLNGSFSLSQDLSNSSNFNFSYQSNENESYFNFAVNGDVTPFPLLQITEDGELRSLDHVSVSCGFPSSSLGCVQKEFLNCRRDDFPFNIKYGFMSRDGFKFKENENMTFIDCRDKCVKNCSCVAFASTSTNATNANDVVNYGCEIWSRGISFRESKEFDARRIYIIESKEKKWWLWSTLSLAGAVVITLLCCSCCLIWRKLKAKVERRKKQKLLLRELQGKVPPRTVEPEKDKRNGQGNELQIFSFESIASATNNFSTANKLGEGGFGPVYKGRLPDGQEIAVKRLSRSSGQGLEEFKNEAILISRLQHTTLVRILGCCVQRDERILIYEYLPNKSLDFFLFDFDKSKLLNWKTRFAIIEGIAQGLIYLHKYSRLRVIHRDLKASNILLDNHMNPKISDFGMARIFGLNQSEANTNRVVGTYGYMSPEYAMNGIVSTKTDVYSFGVLLLEIMSGKKNNGCYSSERPLNLVGYAWQLWNEGRGLELLDPKLDESYSPNEAVRCIHTGLLCVQDFATDRPNMADVVPMLTNETLLLPQPKQPAYFITSAGEEPEMTEIKQEIFSSNDVTISEMGAR